MITVDALLIGPCLCVIALAGTVTYIDFQKYTAKRDLEATKRRHPAGQRRAEHL